MMIFPAVKDVTIGGRLIGPSHPCLVIAEAGVNHNGDLDKARRMIDAAADAGADAVKFQTFKTELVMTRDTPKAEYQKANDGEQGTMFDMVKRLELDLEAFDVLAEHCRQRGVMFMSTAFDPVSLDHVAALNPPALKWPSGEIDNLPLLRQGAAKGLPVILSSEVWPIIREYERTITATISGYVPAYFNGHQASGVAIIPNNKLLESNIFKDRDQYLQVLRKLVKLIGEAGGKPFFLIHEGEKDLRLAKDVSDGFPGPIDIIQEDDPLKVKGMIGASKAVITSRFHGLVSALSQAVPCLCIGWSHKYEALMEDYGYPDGLIGRDDLSGPGLKAKIEAVLRPESAETIRKQLSLAGQEQKKLARAMWDEVFEIING